jgi:hypothetical protein
LPPFPTGVSSPDRNIGVNTAAFARLPGSQNLTRNGQHQTQRAFCNIVQNVVTLWRYLETGTVPEGATLKG